MFLSLDAGSWPIAPLYGVSLTNLNIPSSKHSFHLNPCLEALHKIGKLDERDTIVCSESQVNHDGEGHEVRHPGRKKFRISIPKPSSSDTLPFSHHFCGQVTQGPVATFKDMDMKYRILISVGRLSISDISAARVAAFWLLLCHDLQ